MKQNIIFTVLFVFRNDKAAPRSVEAKLNTLIIVDPFLRDGIIVKKST